MRLGIFGGTFDPPHLGHLLAASDAHEALGLDRTLFVPAREQPLKQGRVEGTGEQRLEMLRLMLAGDARFEVDRLEMDRPGLSYTVDTLAALARRYPDAQRALLLGEDLLAELPRWRQPERIASLAELVVLRRGNDPAPAMGLPVRRLSSRCVEISASEIRARVRAGRSIHGFVADAVATYIHATGLYR